MALPGVPRRTAPLRFLTASAALIDKQDTETRRRQGSDWQKQALFFSSTVPELNYASRFYAKMLSRLRIFPATRDVNDQIKPITSGPPVELLDRIQDSSGGRSSLLRSYGRMMFIVGDGFLFGRDLGTDHEHWSFVSPFEVELADDKIIWRPNTSGVTKEYDFPHEALAYRMWTPDPAFSAESESPMKAVLEIAEELLILTKAVRATAVSRIVNGLLKVPAEISFGSEEPGLDDDPEENKFLADLIDHITGAIENAGAPEASAPFIAEGAGEFLAQLEWIPLHDAQQQDYLERDLRKEAIDRIAMGLDLPPEVLKGFSQANHWGTRQIQLDTWRSHGSILAEQFCDDLGEAYLRPALRDSGFEGWEDVVVAYDDSNVVITNDRSTDADQAYDRGQINPKGYLQMKGIPDDFAGTEEDMRVFLAVKLRNVALLDGTKYEVAKPEPAQTGFPPGPQAANESQPPADNGPPQPGPTGTSRQESQSLELRGAAELALLRCRELAGARIRTAIAKTQNLAALAEIDGRPNSFIAAAFGPERLVELGVREPLALVKGGSDIFVTLCLEWGVSEAHAQALSQTIEVYAARTLFEPRLPQFPSGLAAQIERANEVSTELREEIVRQNNVALERLSGMLGSEAIAV